MLLESFDCVTQSVHPKAALKPFMPSLPKGKLYVVGAGKAAAAMAAAFEEYYEGELEGVVVTRYGHNCPTKQISVREAAHPIPDLAGQKAVQEIIAVLKTATPDDLVICLLSGGGSALLSAPVKGVAFEDLERLNSLLLKSGADITEINTVRKHLNIALGGGLAQAAQDVRMITLSISDVVGDDPATIASGPTVPDPTTLKHAREVLERYNLDAPAGILEALKDQKNETPKTGDKIFNNKDYHLIATPEQALDVAAEYWKEKGFKPYILDAEMTGDTNLCAEKHVDFIRAVLDGTQKIERPCAIISGGETTVKVGGTGDGGPNTQFMLKAAMLLAGNPHIYAMACDTDGIDGSKDNAGAFITPDTLQKSEELGMNADEFLQNNDSYNVFKKLDQLVETGPTYTNVNDYRVFLLLPETDDHCH